MSLGKFIQVAPLPFKSRNPIPVHRLGVRREHERLVRIALFGLPRGSRIVGKRLQSDLNACVGTVRDEIEFGVVLPKVVSKCVVASLPNCEQFCCRQETVALVAHSWHGGGVLRSAVMTDRTLVQDAR